MLLYELYAFEVVLPASIDFFELPNAALFVIFAMHVVMCLLCHIMLLL